MRTLLILRHAKSSWKDEGLPDHDRPLNKRGKGDAPRVGELLRDRGLEPDLIITSTARRARHTAKRTVKAGELSCPVEQHERLYHAGPGDLVEILRSLPDSFVRPMVVGHNPGLETLVEVLTGVAVHLPTAALACVELPIDGWSEIGTDVGGRLVDLWTPRGNEPA
jgi:phosphohistidine phosphatase